MVEKEDLGLSLSLSFIPQNNNQSVQLNLMPALVPSSACSSSPSSGFNLHKASWNDTFPSSGVCDFQI